MLDALRHILYLINSIPKLDFWRTQVNNLKYRLYDGIPKYSWSQSAEDIVLFSLLGGKKKGFYLDVGAHDPTVISVTKLFYDLGWSGINIEANPYKFKVIDQVRTRDINLNYAVGKKKNYKLYIMSASSMSTVNTKALQKLRSEGRTKVLESVSVKGIKLEEILKGYCKEPVDFLNIDIEGQDYEALRSANFESLEINLWPLWISVENQMPIKNTLRMKSVNYLISLGYVVYCILPHVAILRKPDEKL
jgi:FkbM family methyltransferase